MSQTAQSQPESQGAMQALLQSQRAAFMEQLPVPRIVRRERIDRVIDLLLTHRHALCQTMDEDFGGRPVAMSGFVDIATATSALKHARARLRRWMKPDRRRVRFPLNLMGARAWVEYQPKGVVGLISPWNFPVNLTFSPLADILAAGNRVMIKPSEFTPHTSTLMAELFPRYFDATEIAVCTGGPEVGQAFSALPFDHLLFTGATAVGRHILRAAAPNLTPVTLELGGKSPTVIGASADLAKAANRIVLGKLTNAGQVCLAPDYVLIPTNLRDGFVRELKRAVAESYDELAHSADYAAVVNQRHWQRLTDYLSEAERANVETVVLGGDANPTSRRLPLTLLFNPGTELKVMREELFGPILPIRTYERIDQAIDFVNAGERPLALYYFGTDARERRRVLDRTISGGVTLNDVMFHVAVDTLPFGGIGASGMGAYHGYEGFQTFSHAKSVYRQSGFNLGRIMGFKPPYGKRLQRLLRWELRR